MSETLNNPSVPFYAPSIAAPAHNANMRPAIQSANASCAPSRSFNEPEPDPSTGSTAIDDLRTSIDASESESLAFGARVRGNSFSISRCSASLCQKSATKCSRDSIHTRPSSVVHASPLRRFGRLAGRLDHRALGHLALKRSRARAPLFCALLVCSRCVCNVNSRTRRDISNVKFSE